MHYEYLRESGYEGSYRVEIAKRLGLSVQQADRYKKFNKVILPVWDMVRDDIVGMSSVLPMASYTETEQLAILVLFNKAYENGQSLTREFCEKTISNYKNNVDSDNETPSETKQISPEKPATHPPTSSKDTTHSSFSEDENFDEIEDSEDDFEGEIDEKSSYPTDNKSSSSATKIEEKSDAYGILISLSSEQIISLIEYLPNILVGIKFSSPDDYQNLNQLLQKLKDWGVKNV